MICCARGESTQYNGLVWPGKGRQASRKPGSPAAKIGEQYSFAEGST